MSKDGKRWPFHAIGHEPLTERALHVDRYSEVRQVHVHRAQHLGAQVLVDRPAVDGLDDRAEDLPAARRVVPGRGAGLPLGRVGGDALDRLGVGHVEVVGAVGQHRETAGVGEHVAHGRPLLAATPAVHEVRDPVVEVEAALLPQLEDGDGRQRLPGGVPEHHVVGLQRPPGPGLADRGVEEWLAPQRHVDLGAVVPAVADLALQQLQHPGEVGAGRWTGSHGP